MSRFIISSLAAVVVMAATATTVTGAQAQTVSSNATGSFATLETISTDAGELLTPVNTRLVFYTFYIKGGAGLSVVPEVYEWGGSAPAGAALWTGAITPVPSAGYQAYTFTPGITVDLAKQYVLNLRKVDGAGTITVRADIVDNHTGYSVFKDNGSWLSIPSAELHFEALFDAAPSPVPTIGEWAMILLGTGLAGGAALTIQRRRQAA